MLEEHWWRMLCDGGLSLKVLSLKTDWSLNRSASQPVIGGAVSPDMMLRLNGDTRPLSGLSAPSCGVRITVGVEDVI
jgi:hypothetical protein